METTERDEELEGCPSDTGEIGRASVCEGCPGRALCLSQGQADPEQEKLDLRMKAIAHKILVLSGKGGVGKSSVAANLAVALSRKGKKVALLDVDICGPSIPKLMNVEGAQVIASDYGWIPPKDPVHNIPVMSVQFLLGHPDAPVVWRGPRKTSMIKRFLKDTFWGRLDYLIVDTPPGTSDEHLSTITALKNAKPDGAVIVTTPQKVSLVTINKELSFCKKLKLPVLGLIENMSGFVCPCCEVRSFSLSLSAP
ncbi:Cytosolic Fe-S cluster assembly factor NUBP1, variant 2 [Balamuthia mandrillaris]